MPSRTGTPRAAEAIASAIAEVGAGLVDPDAAGDVDEDVGAAERQAGVPREHGDDHREALRVDAGGDAARHREVGRRDERLDLEQERPRALERARDGRADLARLARGRRAPRGRARRRGRRRSSRRRRARSSSRSGSSPRAGCGARGSGRPRTGARSRRGARARAGRRPSRPSSRGRRGTSRRRTPSRRAAAARPPRAPARPSPAPSRARPSRASAPSRSRRRRAARARASRRRRRARSRRGSRPGRSRRAGAARSFTCATDSSPVTSSARRVCEIGAERREQQRRLADAGLAADEHERGRHEAAAEHAVELGDAGRDPRRPPRRRRRRGEAAAVPGQAAAPRAGAASSTSVPNAPQPGHRPSQRPVDVPHSVHAY